MKIKYLLPVLCALGLSACSSVVVESDSVQIAQIDDVYPIRYVEYNSTPVTDETPVVLDLSRENKCDTSYVMMSPVSLGLDKEAFDALWATLRKKTPYIFTYGECDVDGPLVTQIEVCTEKKCGDNQGR